jgi:NADP-dependent 3-hydroxy acid dehydrogenase YdfG
LTEIMRPVDGNAENLEAFLTTMPHLQAKDIADAVVYLLSTPQNVLITELTIRPMNETL